MKLILDECIDRRLTKEFIGYEIKTVPQMGWAGTKNGKLLALIEKEFDVFITVDRNLSFQQNLSQFNISVVVLQPTFSMSKYTQNIFPSRLFCQKKNFIKHLKPNHNNNFMLFAIYEGIQ
jgi:hypothetical protein